MKAMSDNPLAPEGEAAKTNRSLEKLLNNEGPVRENAGTFHCDTYTLYRPWHKCKRCMDAVLGPVEGRDDQGEIERGTPTEELPDDGDRVCPHTNKALYENLAMRIKSEGHNYTPAMPTILADGSVQITMMWWEKSQTEKKSTARPSF